MRHIVPTTDLVGRVEEGQQAAARGHLQDGLPLLAAGVDAGGVVRAGVEQEHGALGRGLQVLQQAVDVEAARGGEVVAVGDRLEAGRLEDGLVVGPGGRRDEHRLGAGVELGQELGAHAQRARAGQRLHRRVAALAQRGAALAKGQARAALAQRGHARLRQVLLVQAGVLQQPALRLAHAREHQRLALLRAGWVGEDFPGSTPAASDHNIAVRAPAPNRAYHTPQTRATPSLPASHSPDFDVVPGHSIV